MWPPQTAAPSALMLLAVVVATVAAAPQQSLRTDLLRAGPAAGSAEEQPLQLSKRSPEAWVHRPWRLQQPELTAAAAGESHLEEAQKALTRTGGALAQQFLRSSRAGSRTHPPYDVPQIECPPGVDGMERFACPTQDSLGRYRCIDDHMLCDGYRACPGGEDEDRQNCMFYKTTKTHLNVLADALLRWVRGR